MAATMVDTVDAVSEMLDALTRCSNQPPLLFFDLEGVNLSRHGTLDILQIYAPALDTVYIVDVYQLQSAAFTAVSQHDQTLQDILQSATYPKVFFDVRTDSDALHYHFQIRLEGVVDLQLVEFATRSVRGRYLKGLQKCISEAGVIPLQERRMFDRVKTEGTRLFAPEHGGRYEVFQERPLDTRLIEYCAQDVRVLPALLRQYARQLGRRMASQVQQETIRRVELSQSPQFVSKGRHMAIGPQFQWSSRRIVPVLDFPISLICSMDLDHYCQPSGARPATDGRATVHEAQPTLGTRDQDLATLIDLDITRTMRTLQLTNKQDE